MDEKNDLINKSDKLDDGSEPKNDTSSLNSTQTANPDDGSVKSKHNADAVRAALHEARKKAVAKRSLAISAGRVGDDGTSNGSSTTSGDDNSGDADEISEIDEFVLANSDDIENDSKDSSALSDIQFVEPDEEENDDTDINTPPDYELYDIDANSDTEEETEAGKRPKKPSFRMKTRTFMQKYGYLGLAFLVPALTMWLIYIAMGTYPFGQGSVLVLDLNGQYVYYFEQLRKIVLGDQSWVYTFGRALGGEFMGIYAYYLASPFSFLVCLFPKQMITEALLLMFLLKTGCSGLTFGIYLHNKTEKKAFNRTAIVMFSTLYALTAYAVVQQHNTMWIDNLIMLPLIILGMERLIKRGRFKLFIITLTWAVMSNFYIGYMMCIFVFVYFFVCYFSMKPEERNPNFESAHFVKTLLRIGGCAVLVLGMSTVILWSAYYSLTFGKTTFSNPNYSFNSKFDLLDLVTKLFIGSYDTVRPEGLPFVYCGTITLLLLPLFFMIKKIPIREKIAGGFMTVFFVFCFEGSTIDIAWHGFQRPNWLNYRYSFMLCFFMVLMAYRAFIYIREVQVPVIIADCFFWVFVLVILQKYDYKNVTDYGTVWLSIAFFAIYLILLRFHVRSSYISGMSVAIAAIIVLEMFTAGLLNLVALDDDVVYSKRTSYRNFIDRLQPVVDMVKENDNSFYRMEKTVHRKTNDSLALGFRGLSNSTSTLNSSTIKFLNRLGLSSKSHWSKYLGGTPVLDTLLGLKYIIAEEDDSVSSLYELAYEYDPGEAYANLYAYKNPYALPIAYGVSEDLLSYNMESDDSPFDRMNQIISKMLGSTEKIEVFVPINIESTDTQYVNISYTTGHRIYTRNDSEVIGKVYFTIKAPKTGNIYCYFPSDYLRECDLYLNNTKIGTYFGNETYRVVDLGTFESGEELNISLRLVDNDKLYLMTESTYFYYIDETVFETYMPQLSVSGYNIEKYTEDSFYGTIDVKEGDELIFTSIPYDKGWVVKVDGKEVETFEALDAVMVFRASAGKHTISMEYRPDCVIYGRLISLFFIAIFILVCITDFIIRKHRTRLETEGRRHNVYA